VGKVYQPELSVSFQRTSIFVAGSLKGLRVGAEATLLMISESRAFKIRVDEGAGKLALGGTVAKRPSKG